MGNNSQFVIDYKKRSIEFSVGVITFCDSLPKTTSAQVIAKQLLRCATSVGANFVEAQAAPTQKDFLNFLSIALKSGNETVYWLVLLERASIGDINMIKKLQCEVEELSKILGSIISKLRNKNR